MIFCLKSILLLILLICYQATFAAVEIKTLESPIKPISIPGIKETDQNSIRDLNQSAPLEFLVIGDIHFDPFIGCESQPKPCPLIKALSKANSKDWSDIFAQYHDSSTINYQKDTSDALLLSLQQQLKTQKPRFVLVMGDYLAHFFYQKYVTYSGDEQGKYYLQFLAKTNHFLASIILNAFPTNTPIYPVIGNNDTDAANYCKASDYCSGQQDYLHYFTRIWQLKQHAVANFATQDNPLPMSDDHNLNSSNWEPDLKTKGYYRVFAANKGEPNLIILNSVLFSNHMNDSQTKAAAQQELAWLAMQLKQIQTQGQKAWLIMHIPPGIDAYRTYKNIFRTPALFWREDDLKQFFSLLQKYHDVVNVMLSAHTHMDNAILIHLKHPGTLPDRSSQSGILVDSGTPAISPIYNTNPAYKVYDYNPKLQINNFKVYFLSLTAHPKWQLEYDFMNAYLNNCPYCSLIKGFEKISDKINDGHTQKYIHYFSAGVNSQPIMSDFGYPYYWCALHQITEQAYTECIYNRLPSPPMKKNKS